MNDNVIFIRLENVKGERTGTLYNGEFQVKKYLKNRESADATRLAETLCRGIERDVELINLLTTVAHLAFHIEKSPDWWGDKGLDLSDKEPIWALAEQLVKEQKPKEESAPA